jgi:thiosulfate reductase cytochrome b subunit
MVYLGPLAGYYWLLATIGVPLLVISGLLLAISDHLGRAIGEALC